ncbi:MAG TPA: glycosyltransferase family 39 protein [Bryobacteraceae bacterium]|nr:glycosyltransferase family 39 protein [Bryobacteraceae bacterium]
MRAWLLIAALVAVIRLPFLWTPIQGDDPYYLFGAQHAQIDARHPSHARYLFQGKEVDMRGHPHPPGNAWYLAALLAWMDDVREMPFHAAYLLWTVLAAAAAYSLARRFSTTPVWATALFLATPAFVINGNSLESDLPFVALWLTAFALFIRAVDSGKTTWLMGAAVALAAATMMAYQAIAAIPILGFCLWQRRRAWPAAWVALLMPVAVIAAYQLFERMSSGTLPAQVLTGYFMQYGLQSAINKLRNATMLTIHMGWVVFPALVWLAWRKGSAVGSNADRRFLWVWIGVFYAFAITVFFAGAMRYLLPLVLPVALLIVERLREKPRWLAAGLTAQLGLSLALCVANYQHWAGYRDFVASLRPQLKERRVWVNSELGLRYYAEADGALPMEMGQAVRPGDLVISSKLAFPVPFTTGGGVLTPLAERRIEPRLPLQLIGLHAHSGYSSAGMGFLPFAVTSAPVDIVRADVVVERRPVRIFLPMNAPDAEQHIVSGVYSLESGAWRWTAGRAVFLLKSPHQALPLRASVRVFEQSPVRRVTLQVDGETVVDQQLAVGPAELESRPVRPRGDSATVVLTVDRTFQAGGDQRELGVILTGVGFH